MEENSIWKSCITAKYGIVERGWFTLCSKGDYGDGKKIIFWEDT